MGQLTGTCFQRCAGLDTLSVLFSITYDIDKKHGTPYHERYVNFLKKAQQNNLIVGAGMTDPKVIVASAQVIRQTPTSSCTLRGAPKRASTSKVPRRT